MFYILIVFMFLYIPYVNIAGVTLHLPYFFAALMSIVFVRMIIGQWRVEKGYIAFFIVFLLSYMWILLISSINGQVDIEMQINYLNGFLVMLAGFGIGKLFINQYGKEAIIFIVKAIYISGSVHAVVMIAAFFVEPFREFLYTYVVLGDKGIEFLETSSRSPGLTTGGGDGLSVIQAIALVFGVYHYLLMRLQANLAKHLLYIASFVLLFLSILMSARTGLVVLFLGLCIIATRQLGLLFFRQKIEISVNRKILIILTTFFFALPAIYVLLVNSEYTRLTHRAFELYNNYVQNDKIGTTSTEHLRTMYFMPETENILTGNGNFGRDPALGMLDTDVGYIRVMNGAGVAGVLLIYMPFVLLLLIYLPRAIRLDSSIILIFLVTTLLVLNFKVLHVYGGQYGFKAFILFFSVLAASSKLKGSAIKFRHESFFQKYLGVYLSENQRKRIEKTQ